MERHVYEVRPIQENSPDTNVLLLALTLFDFVIEYNVERLLVQYSVSLQWSHVRRGSSVWVLRK
jgi:hypothetical protein